MNLTNGTWLLSYTIATLLELISTVTVLTPFVFLRYMKSW